MISLTSQIAQATEAIKWSALHVEVSKTRFSSSDQIYHISDQSCVVLGVGSLGVSTARSIVVCHSSTQCRAGNVWRPTAPTRLERPPPANWWGQWSPCTILWVMHAPAMYGVQTLFGYLAHLTLWSFGANWRPTSTSKLQNVSLLHMTMWGVNQVSVPHMAAWVVRELCANMLPLQSVCRMFVPSCVLWPSATVCMMVKEAVFFALQLLLTISKPKVNTFPHSLRMLLPAA